MTVNDLIIRLAPMPNHIHAYVMEDPDGNYNVYLNEDESYYEHRKALRHEIAHIKRGHLKDLAKTVQRCEEEAEE